VILKLRGLSWVIVKVIPMGFLTAKYWRFQKEILKLTAKGLGFLTGIRSDFLKQTGLSWAILRRFLTVTDWRFQMEILKLTAKGWHFLRQIQTGFLTDFLTEILRPKATGWAILTGFQTETLKLTATGLGFQKVPQKAILRLKATGWSFPKAI
jgi:hypothetical protein